MAESDVHCKALSGVPNRGAYISYYERLEASGCGPRIATVTDEQICIEKCETLRHWVDERAVDGRLPNELRRAMGRELRELLERVHDLGFCHRDIHVRNFVVRNGAPLLVDPKYAIEHRGRRCYDLAGPGASGVAIPLQHLAQAGNRNDHGVWWENADPLSEALTSTFGPLAELGET
ncbi:MAG: lipopolysaccharide kinase InaA family protein [Solirubrobacteraceae bacterium]